MLAKSLLKSHHCDSLANLTATRYTADRVTSSPIDQKSILLKRIGAYLLDISILFIILAPTGFLIQHVLGLSPSTAKEIYLTLVLNFSVPAWFYFACSDQTRRGATIGKRLLSLRTETETSGQVRMGKATVRTAVKMIPWELTHASGFLLAPALGELSPGNYAGIGMAYILIFVYLIVAWRTNGRRSTHDIVANTQVNPLYQPIDSSAA